MLSSSCARRRSTLPFVKLRSRLLTDLNLLPSMATLAVASRPSSRHSSTKRAQTWRKPRPLSLRKSAIVLWVGHQTAQEPKKLQIASRFALEPPAATAPD